jgi:integrase
MDHDIRTDPPVPTAGRRAKRPRGCFERPAGSGIWWVRYRDQHGRLHREKVGPKGLAKKVYQKRRTELAEGRFFPEERGRRDVLLRDYLRVFMRKHVTGRLRNAVHYAQYARRWEAALGTHALRSIVPDDIAEYAAERRERDGRAPATINRELAFLRRVFNAAIASRVAETNPVRSRKQGGAFTKENNQRVRHLLPEEEAALAREIPDLADWSKLVVALHTGLRRGEQFGLRWEHVDFTTGVITIPDSKSGEPRHLPMNDTVRAVLRALPSRLKSPWVFPSDTGETPLDAQNFVNRVFLPALRRAQIDNFHWHDLRHTFASRLVMKGVDLRTVQELLGHKTLAMTLRYAHLSPGHKLDAVQRLNAVDSGGASITTGITGAPRRSRAASAGGVEVLDPADENGSGGALDRTGDLGIMSPSHSESPSARSTASRSARAAEAQVAARRQTAAPRREAVVRTPRRPARARARHPPTPRPAGVGSPRAGPS